MGETVTDSKRKAKDYIRVNGIKVKHDSLRVIPGLAESFLVKGDHNGNLETVAVCWSKTNAEQVLRTLRDEVWTGQYAIVVDGVVKAAWNMKDLALQVNGGVK